MILTHDSILEAKNRGDIVIEPFEPSLVSINSVDVRLGPNLWQLKKQKVRDIYNPKDEDWEKISPVKVKEIRLKLASFGKDVLKDDDLAFVLKSGEFYLATTLEKIGTRLPKKKEMRVGATTRSIRPICIVSEMKAKSTVGRQGLTVALCAGLGDVGYASSWALEVRVTDDGDVPVAVNTPIAQVVFSQAVPTDVGYDGVDRYQNGEYARFLPKPLKIIRSN